MTARPEQRSFVFAADRTWEAEIGLQAYVSRILRQRENVRMCLASMANGTGGTRSADAAGYRRSVKGLRDAIGTQFGHEDFCMIRSDYSGIFAHMREHDELLNFLRGATQDETVRPAEERLRTVARVTQEWLIGHRDRWDKGLLEHLTRERRCRRPSVARRSDREAAVGQ